MCVSCVSLPPTCVSLPPTCVPLPPTCVSLPPTCVSLPPTCVACVSWPPTTVAKNVAETPPEWRWRRRRRRRRRGGHPRGDDDPAQRLDPSALDVRPLLHVLVVMLLKLPSLMSAQIRVGPPAPLTTGEHVGGHAAPAFSFRVVLGVVVHVRLHLRAHRLERVGGRRLLDLGGCAHARPICYALAEHAAPRDVKRGRGGSGGPQRAKPGRRQLHHLVAHLEVHVRVASVDEPHGGRGGQHRIKVLQVDQPRHVKCPGARLAAGRVGSEALVQHHIV